MLIANVCARFISSCSGEFGNGVFWAFGLLFCVLCVWEGRVTLVCLLLDTPFGRRSVGALPLFRK